MFFFIIAKIMFESIPELNAIDTFFVDLEKLSSSDFFNSFSINSTDGLSLEFRKSDHAKDGKFDGSDVSYLNVSIFLSDEAEMCASLDFFTTYSSID